jgi:hypothetical protein
MKDDDILLSLIGDPSELLTVNLQSATHYGSTTTDALGSRPRTNPLKRNGGMVCAVNPSPTAMENPSNSNNSHYDVNEI